MLDTIDEMFLYIFNGLNERCKPELAAINAQYAFEPLAYRKDKRYWTDQGGRGEW